MSQYSALNIPTKKALKESVGQFAADLMQNDSFFDSGIHDGHHTCVGPHAYNRKWYAQVRIEGGRITKVT